MSHSHASHVLRHGKAVKVKRGGHLKTITVIKMVERCSHKRVKIGYDYVHTAIDHHTRPAYPEIHKDEKDATWEEDVHLLHLRTHGARQYGRAPGPHDARRRP